MQQFALESEEGAALLKARNACLTRASGPPGPTPQPNITQFPGSLRRPSHRPNIVLPGYAQAACEDEDINRPTNVNRDK